MLDEREAFLRAIFDAPAENTPRLVYADWLDERGEQPLLAELIRLQCEWTAGHDVIGRERTWGLLARRRELICELYGYETDSGYGVDRGFLIRPVIEVHADLLADARAFRERSVTANPEWFGATELKVVGGRITDARPFDTLFTAPAARRVTLLDLSGIEERVVGSEVDPSGAVTGTAYDFFYRPVVTTPGVVALAGHRGAHRVTELDLTNNELGNDAARAVVRSGSLENLRSLRLYEGNRLRGRVWQEVVERFGHDVLGGDGADA
jgi:uncharacterized protein (TIGR02996 family)